MIQKKILNVKKQCESCGSNNHKKLWSYTQNSKQRSTKFVFEVNHVICKECGFVFLSPTYSDKDLTLYYQDSFTYYIPDFNTQHRLNFIKENQIGKGNFLEIGGNEKNSFHEELSKMFDRVEVQDLNQSGNTDKNVDFVSTNSSYDCVAHYFVLEHVPNVNFFLRNCYDLLKPGGYMIVEVPDLKKYKTFFHPLIFHEHTNHFTIEILEKICSKIGFQLIVSDVKTCSREFGFSALFKKISVSEKILSPVFSNKFQMNLKYFEEGKKECEKFEKFILDVYSRVDRITKSGKNILFWGANSILRDIVINKPKLQNVSYIDSDIRKKYFLEDLGLKVLNPSVDKINFNQFDKLVICAGKNYLDQILKFIKKEGGYEFRDQDVWIVSELKKIPDIIE